MSDIDYHEIWHGSVCKPVANRMNFSTLIIEAAIFKGQLNPLPIISASLKTGASGPISVIRHPSPAPRAFIRI